jgi:hypothetical protein
LRTTKIQKNGLGCAMSESVQQKKNKRTHFNSMAQKIKEQRQPAEEEEGKKSEDIFAQDY